MTDTVKKFLKRLGVELHDEGLMVQALTHRSYGSTNNERMEFLGDSVLGMVISEYIFQHFPELDEGNLSRFRSRLVREETLAEIAVSLGVSDVLRLGQGELKSGGFNRPSILSDAFEAVIAAVFLDRGFDYTREFLLRIYESRLANAPSLNKLKDGKTRLQEYLQGKKLDLPTYQVVQEKTDHPQSFTVECAVNDLDMTTTASAGSIRKAEKKAAEKLLGMIGV
jgi:ribonuclease III